MRGVFSHAIYCGRGLCIGGQMGLRRRPVIQIGKVAGKFADGVSNLGETFLVKRATLGINLRKLQTLQGDLIIV